MAHGSKKQDITGSIRPLKIFIASSSELHQERTQIIRTFNSINKYNTHLKIEAVEWETDVESGSYDKQRVQDEINPLMEDCRIVIVLFYSKIGKFTFEEYQLAVDSKKKVFLYFKKQYHPRSIDDIDAYRVLLQYKESLHKENRAIYKEYETINQFENFVIDDLNKFIDKQYPPPQAKKQTEYDEYLANVTIITGDFEASTSAPIFGKILQNIDQQTLTDFLHLELVNKALLGDRHKSIEQKLTQLGLMYDASHLKKGTFLCMGKYIHEICPIASFSKFFVFRDTKRIDPAVNIEVRGNLISQHRQMEMHLKKNLYLIRDIFSDKKEDYEIPGFVIRELLANAFVHRDYDNDILSTIQVELFPDRLEIKNPGTLPDEIDMDKICESGHSYMRNPEISSIFFLHKFVERAGSGIPRVQELLKENGFEEAQITGNKRGKIVRAVVYKKKGEVTNRFKRTKTQLLTRLPVQSAVFIGRQHELNILKKKLEKDDRTILVNGMGGIGKTEVCKKFFREHYQSYEFAGWVDYYNSIKESFVNAFSPNLVGGEDNDTLNERYQKITYFFQRKKTDTLLVIDNITNADDENLDILLSLPFTVIVNSRINLHGFESLSLGLLSLETCMELFYQYYDVDRRDEYVKKIILLCGHHTLAVELLAKTAHNAAITPKKLYEKLETTGFNLNDAVGAKVSTSWHDEKQKKTLFDHLLIIFDLSDVSKNEQHVLANMSVLPAADISINELRSWLKLESNQSTNSLVEKGWFKRQGTAIIMHRVLQDVVRHKLSPDVEVCKNLIDSLNEKLYLHPFESPIDKKNTAVFAKSLFEHLPETEPELASLANNLSIIYQNLGQPEIALEYQKQSLATFEAVLDKNHPSLATAYNNLSQIYKDLGQLEMALEFQKKSADILEPILDTNHPSLATVYNNLSLIYKELGQLEKALEFQKKDIEISENILDKNHPLLATSYNNISLTYRYLGQLEKALEFQIKATKIFEEVLNQNHPSIGTSYSNLSKIYQSLGQLEMALEFQERSAAIFEAVLDANHPSLATSYYNKSTIYLEMKQYQHALQYAEQAVAILEHLFPEGHPDLDTMKTNLEKIKERST